MLEAFKVQNEDQLLTPGLLVFPDRVQHNIDAMVQVAGGTKRLIPHVKTHKMSAVIKLQMQAGIRQFKCATLAEMKLLIDCEAERILLAHQPSIEKIHQFIHWQKEHSEIEFATLVDNLDSLQLFSDLAQKNNIKIKLWIDVNNGMNRTGILPEKAFSLYEILKKNSRLEFQGLHVYDGHIRPLNLDERISKCNSDFEPVANLVKQIEKTGGVVPEIITGGSPSFYPHALREKTLLSPGTTLLWDLGYKKIWKESPFVHAALLITRLISKPNTNLYCFDLGHKAVASEMPLPRVEILGLEKAIHKGQSEEHLIVEFNEKNNFKVGDLFYALPYHICPTVAKYNRAYTVINGEQAGYWNIEARDYQIELKG
ncbi:D-TA family PLP-dependent enzyme [Flavobacteriaceae bacterium]|nr:D-TA family PLP-dependent enzyme [Flavobacteriaceae bacterium]MDA9015730.1 D-TA family PLP-dependent enzyme [Flavobacteriaceae bacterium]MDB3862027.1 D-TA family PLP-dependent enzyme [Flavobacteriaceae bacterium]MDC3354277.1 D-TA family PLP-dependent enzyme [Flavobacteriaceae bacterium]